ncbi:transcriptional regulator [Flammeovirga pectinis]|uniref:Transcriptional regulator n=1 Tax=Flammeovirga pectinis TaxID=2494373 RepID=A0A3Q9FN90_9BACT|nr:helix-turn-helix domain-containing protein [Flammeovirga pectinis]AZQ63672.1 transcriptional regulator [Flammeovirga pectinis]
MINKKYECSLRLTMDLIGNKWKPLVLFHLLEGGQRSGELQKTIPEVSNKMFTQTVRELEEDNLVKRTVYAEVPPKVVYELTDLGRSLEGILISMDLWGKEVIEKQK